MAMVQQEMLTYIDFHVNGNIMNIKLPLAIDLTSFLYMIQAHNMSQYTKICTKYHCNFESIPFFCHIYTQEMDISRLKIPFLAKLRGT